MTYSLNHRRPVRAVPQPSSGRKASPTDNRTRRATERIRPARLDRLEAAVMCRWRTIASVADARVRQHAEAAGLGTRGLRVPRSRSGRLDRCRLRSGAIVWAVQPHWLRRPPLLPGILITLAVSGAVPRSTRHSGRRSLPRNRRLRLSHVRCAWRDRSGSRRTAPYATCSSAPTTLGSGAVVTIS